MLLCSLQGNTVFVSRDGSQVYDQGLWQILSMSIQTRRGSHDVRSKRVPTITVLIVKGDSVPFHGLQPSSQKAPCVDRGFDAFNSARTPLHPSCAGGHPFTPVLATCGIRRSELACENPACCLLLLADSSAEEYHGKHSLAHLHVGGNVYRAGDSHLFQAVGRSWPSVTPPLLRRLDRTGAHQVSAGDVVRPFPQQF